MRAKTTSLYVALALSGAAALVYELTWGRMLQRVFGVSDFAIATVLAAFFLGLGIGNALGGQRAARLSRPVLVYGLLEGGIGLYALASLLVIPRVHAIFGGLGENASFETLSLVRLALALVILLPPTIMMGATMPVLVAMLARDDEWATPATRLYATNTLGAVVGAGITGLWLVPTFGARAAIVVAALGSLGAAAIVLAAFRRAADAPPSAAASGPAVTLASEPATDTAAALAQPPTGSLDSDEGTPRLAALLAAMAGLGALAGEVVWTRVLRTVVQGTTQAFAVMLVNFLCGIALGSLLATRLGRGPRSARFSLGITQVVIALLSAFALVFANQIPRILGPLQGRISVAPSSVGVLLVVSAALLFPLALGIGTAVPLAWRAAGGVGAVASQRAGRVLAANTLGGLVGSLVAGFVLVPSLGVNLTVMALVAVHVVTAIVALRSAVSAEVVPRVLALTGPLAVAAAILWAGPAVDLPFLIGARTDAVSATFYGPGEKWRKDLVFLREGRNTTVTLGGTNGNWRLANDGRPESGFSPRAPGFGPELVLLGALPAVLSPHHDRAMAVGLGGGHTASVLLAGGFARVDVVELEEAVVEASRLMYRLHRSPHPLDDPRAKLVIDDARARLNLAASGTYDAIVSQPSHPWLAGSSALYTREFFEESRRALRPTGVLSLWVNLFRMDTAHVASVVRTLREVFPHVNAWLAEGTSLVLVASAQPLHFAVDAASRVGEGQPLYAFTNPFGMASPQGILAYRELDDEGTRQLALRGAVIVDDRPSLEFDLARLPESASVGARDLDAILKSVPWTRPDATLGVRTMELAQALSDRLDRMVGRPDAIGRIERALPGLSIDEGDREYLRARAYELRGNVSRALALYDASSSFDAAAAADEIRLQDRRYRELVTLTLARPEVEGVEPALVAAIALEDTQAMQALLARANATTDEPLAGLVRAYLASGCSGIATSPPAVVRAVDSFELATLLLRCAFEGSRADMVDAYARERARILRARASRAASSANEALAGKNIEYAEVVLRRAFAYNPAYGGASTGLARLLDQTNRHAEAERVLRTALFAASGLSNTVAQILATAGELHIDLGQAASAAGAPAGGYESSSVAPVTASMMDGASPND